MNTATLYNKHTGRIIQQLIGPQEFIEANVPDGCEICEGSWNDSDFYVKIDTPIKRPESPVVLNGHTLENVPNNGMLYIDGVAYSLNGESVELEFPLPGTYALRVEAFPFKDWTGSITV